MYVYMLIEFTLIIDQPLKSSSEIIYESDVLLYVFHLFRLDLSLGGYLFRLSSSIGPGTQNSLIKLNFNYQIYIIYL